MDQLPAAGDRVMVPVLTGYRMVQDRPRECYYRCVCGDCYGHTVEYPGIVEKVIHYADNSIESEVMCDDGKRRRLIHAAPHGDPC
jgi:hypothetical protein